MIEIKNLFKIYKSKKKNNHKALDDINLILPDTGLTFIIGKSGSGKSTLLNLLGGLDNASSGSIVVDGNDITNYNENDLADYRNNYIGFIFQDYHLLDELTVYENIVLSLNLTSHEDDGLVHEALKTVGLSGFENRYPTELSGGERQRVAIARAIVKKPSVILADEPTGNLDNVTATSIIELLKELSKECLIVIVSHNTNDTFKYADRIIKLSNGKICEDISRNPLFNDKLYVVDDIIYYPTNNVLTEEDVILLNQNKNKKIVKVDDKYIPTKSEKSKHENKPLGKNKLSFKNILKFSMKFLKTKYFKIVLSSLMSAFLLIILLFSISVVSFDSGKILSSELQTMNQTSLVLEKTIKKEYLADYKRTYVGAVGANDKTKIKELGYKGDIYDIYAYILPISEIKTARSEKNEVLCNNIFANETVGTIIVDEEYLLNKFGSDGNINYLAVSEEWRDDGLIITDYIADSILYTNSLYQRYLKSENPYENLLGYYHFDYEYTRGYINAVIDTDYETKYKDLWEYESTIEVLDSNQTLLSTFISDVYTRLGITYSCNKDLLQSLKANKPINYVYIWKVMIDDEIVELPSYAFAYVDSGLKENEILLSYNFYNEAYGTKYDNTNLDEFIPHSANFKELHFNDFKGDNVLIDENVQIVGLYDGYHGMLVNENLYNELYEVQNYSYALLLDGVDGIESVVKEHTNLDFEIKSAVVESLYTMTKVVDVFTPIFELVSIVLCVGVILILISFSSKMIKDKYHDIGILKALGCKNINIGTIFGLQLLLIALITILLSEIGYYFFIDLANDVLVASLRELSPNKILMELEFLVFQVDIAIFGALLILLLAIVSYIIPMLKIYRIKPVQIIKVRE